MARSAQPARLDQVSLRDERDRAMRARQPCGGRVAARREQGFGPPQVMHGGLGVPHVPLRRCGHALQFGALLGKAGRDAVGEKNMDFHPGILNDGSQLGVGKDLSAPPVMDFADQLVEEAVVSHWRALLAKDRQSRPGRRNVARTVGAHFQVESFDWNLKPGRFLKAFR